VIVTDEDEGQVEPLPTPDPAPTAASVGSNRAPEPDSAAALDVFRAHVARALAQLLDRDELITNDDGEWPVKAGSAIVIVRVIEGLPPVLQLYSPVLRGVALTAELLEALNAINGRIRYGRAFVANHVVIVAMELPGVDLTPAHVAFACAELGNLADHMDDSLRGRFGGEVAFDPNPLLVN
jgi:hypothetical protein